MREIKFEIYDKNKQKFISFEEYKELWTIHLENDWTISFSSDYLFTNNMMIQKDVFILCQYIWMKDRNKKDVKNWDIINEYEDDELLWTYVIEYKDNWYWPKWRDNEYWFSEDNEFEIIGNIYENPNLLK
jgi:hypothetical protein